MQTFKEVVKGIRKSEKNVDKVLKAARIERHEKSSMSTERLELILGFAAGIFIAILLFAFLIVLFVLMKR